MPPAWLHRSNGCGKMRDSSLISTAVFAVLDANHGVTGSWLRFPVFSVRSWRTPWDSLGLILWRPRPGRFSSEVRRKLIIRTLVEISEESRKCCRTLSKTGLSQHSLAELGHSLRISTRFKNQVLKKFHWNFPLVLLYWRYSNRVAFSGYSRVRVTSLRRPAPSSRARIEGTEPV